MGLDIYIDKVKNPRTDNEQREELCYWRKNRALLNIVKYSDDDYAKDVTLSKEDVENILDHVCHNRDYFDSFRTVEQVCELLDRYDEYKEDGYSIVFNANW